MAKNEALNSLLSKRIFVLAVIFICVLNSNLAYTKKVKNSSKNHLRKSLKKLKNNKSVSKRENIKLIKSKSFRFKERIQNKDDPIVTSIWSAHRNLLPKNAFKVMNDYSLNRSNDQNSVYGDSAKLIDTIMSPHNSDVVRKVIKDNSGQ